MKSCFIGDMKVIQYFGNVLWSTPDYKTIVKESTPGAVEFYKRWNMKGHNGWDVVPADVYDMGRIYSFYAGVIVGIVLNHPDYGNGLRIYIPELQVVEYHNHMKWLSAEAKLLLDIRSKFFIGQMGSTGASIGAHDHIAFAKVDKTCFDKNGILKIGKDNRLNEDNGYLGYINPAPYIG